MIMTSGIGCIGLSLYLWDAKPFESAPITGVITTATNEYGSKYGWRERAHGRGSFVARATKLLLEKN